MTRNIRAVIIDDMPLAIASLKADIEDLDLNIELVGTAEGVISGAKLLKEQKPDLIFLDIHMGDGDGFDLLEMIEHERYQVIFTTASEDHAIQAFKFSALDYLLKPIAPDRLKAAVSKFTPDTMAPISKDLTIALNTQEEMRLVKVDDITRLEAMGNYTSFYLADGDKILVTKTLKDFEKILPEHFLRVHQSHLINKKMIKSYIKTEGGYIKMTDGSDVPVSVRKKAFVIQELSQ